MHLKILKTKCTLDLGTCADAYKSEEMKECLINALNEQKPLTINGKEIERIDTVCAQILVSAKNSFDKAGQNLEVVNMSDSMTKSLSYIGLDTYFNVSAGE